MINTNNNYNHDNNQYNNDNNQYNNDNNQYNNDYNYMMITNSKSNHYNGIRKGN